MSQTTDEVRKLVGDPANVAEELKRFSDNAQALSADHPRMIEEYPKQWVAVFHRKVAAQAANLRALLSEVDAKELPRDEIIVRFIEKNHRIMIL